MVRWSKELPTKGLYSLQSLFIWILQLAGGVLLPMSMNIKKSVIVKTSVLLAFLLILTSCGFWLVPFRQEKVREYALRGANFEDALDLSVKAAKDIRFDITGVNKKHGKFEGQRGFGLDEITLLYFRLKKGYKKKLYFTVRVKSSRSAKAVIKAFNSSLSKYMDVLPMMPEEEAREEKPGKEKPREDELGEYEPVEDELGEYEPGEDGAIEEEIIDEEIIDEALVDTEPIEEEATEEEALENKTP